MSKAGRNPLLYISLTLLVGAQLQGAAPNSEMAGSGPKVSFNRDIRPILSANCYTCHGFDSSNRKGNLRLDTEEGAVALQEGRQAVKPGDLAQSELWRRVSSSDPQLVMPPANSGKVLKPEQVVLLRQWIEGGAAYQKHWAFEPPQRPTAPPIQQTHWPVTEMDRFVLASLEGKKLNPLPEASRSTLLRRVTLDLTGLPPTGEELAAFLADTQPGAYERVVDRLLSSPRYGEHMARYWLDVARYGDTHGLHLDNERSLWAYRDWVVDAFNKNLRFDEFTIWQLAGDLLPNPTREQLVASGFNRCNVSTSEGGAIDEEFQVRYAVDRVETMSTAWMGLTLGCAVCHDHKLDPITQKEFYQVFSIFNNISEKAMDGNAILPPPSLSLPNPEQEKQLAELDAIKKGFEQRLQELVSTLDYTDPASLTNRPKPEAKETVWLEDDYPPHATVNVNGGNEPSSWIGPEAASVYSGQRALQRRGKGLHQVFFTSSDAPLTVNPGDTLYAYVYLDPKDPPKAVMLQYYTDNWKVRANWGDPDAISYGAKGTTEKVQVGPLPETGRWVRLEIGVSALGLPAGTKLNGLAFTLFDGNSYWDKAGLVGVNDPALDPQMSFGAWQTAEQGKGDKSSAPASIKDLLKLAAEKLTAPQRQELQTYYLKEVYVDPKSGLAPLRAELKSNQSRKEALEKEIPATMISRELDPPRPAWVLLRGQYDKHGEPVGPGVPAILPPLPQGEVTNRLTFARWLVDTQNPLTARVTVNRFWQQFFGVGLVKTAEDFGNKGDWPSHPELLDWLATEFQRSGWDVKGLVRLMVTSASYRQDSRVSPELAASDPENRWLARGPRHRLDAEVLRDYALGVSGLLNLQTGGRGVRPYQPAGIWEAVAYTTSNTAKYSRDTGDALYRRSLYLFWKRTAPPPSMTTLDAPSREQCRARRERTNTPLQALLLMNETGYFEAARHLGYRMWKEGGSEDSDRLRFGFQLVTSRSPEAPEAAVLIGALAAQRERYAADPEAAKKTVSVGESPVPVDVPPADLAAYTMVANLLLNLDEAVTKN